MALCQVQDLAPFVQSGVGGRPSGKDRRIASHRRDIISLSTAFALFPETLEPVNALYPVLKGGPTGSRT